MKSRSIQQSSARVMAVIVTFHPELTALRRLLTSLVGQVTTMVIVDNGSSIQQRIELSRLAELMPFRLFNNEGNIGLAAAQNIGISLSQSEGYEFTLLLDQDSQLAPRMVEKLLEGYREYSKAEPIAAIGPTIRDSRMSPMVKAESYRLLKVPFLISSGTLLNNTAVNLVGLMDESLFIDHIDHDWCFRVTSLGYTLYSHPAANLFHALGDKLQRVWFLRWRMVSLHAPSRDYYKLRNAILLSRRDYVPVCWRFFLVNKNLLVSAYSILLASKKRARLSLFLRAIADGVRGRGGALP